MTTMQKLVSRFWNIYRDEDFIRMIECLDDSEYWQHIHLESLTDKECVGVLKRLSNIYSQWNNS